MDKSARWSLRLPAPLALAGFALDMPVNRASRNGHACSPPGSGRMVLVAPAGDAPDFSALEGRHYSLVDVSHRYAAFAVEGDSAPLILAAGCPLDLHPDFFTPGTATRTLLGKAERRWRLGEAPSYRVECARSFAGYVAGLPGPRKELLPG